MLISFTVENWKSFRDETVFSMVSSRERQHGERVPRVKKYGMGILPISAIYGGNASGKTNLIAALGFCQGFVIQGSQPDSLIPTEPFLLNDNKASQPSHFAFELLIDDTVYAFSFSVTRKEVLEEKLVRINSTTEKMLYHRRGAKVKFDNIKSKRLKLMEFVAQSTRGNQLFLTNSVFQNMKEFRNVYGWFREQLVLVGPQSAFGRVDSLVDEKHPMAEEMTKAFQELDTGIEKLVLGKWTRVDDMAIPEPIKREMRELVMQVGTLDGGILYSNLLGERCLVTINPKSSQIMIAKLMTLHKKADGSLAHFNLRQESSGSQRLLDLLPVFLELAGPDAEQVYVIDEVDRSLHTMLIRKLLTTYLEACSQETRMQLLLTTHDTQIMDQDLFRRDEMWVAERDETGASKLIALSEYKDIRHDKDIRKSYLQGRMGGIPVFQPKSDGTKEPLIG